MANPYPADVADSGGNVRLSGAITFTDADNQPGGGGGANTVTLLGPFAVAYNTPDFFNPETGNGAETLSIPAGSFVQAFALITEAFAELDAADQLILALEISTSSSGGTVLANYTGNVLAPSTFAVALREPFPLISNGSPLRRAALAVVDCKILAVYYPDGATTLTAGGIDVYAYVATPT